VADASLAAHNRGYSNDVVRIGRVAHAKKKTERNDGKESKHLSQDRGSSKGKRAAALEQLKLFLRSTA
jgi:hypothetical protein